MHPLRIFLFFALTMLLALPSYALSPPDRSLFNKIFSEWTEAFNHADVEKSCALFSPEVIADYRGFPQKNYPLLCEGFKNIFSQKKRRYQYEFKLHEIYQSENLTAVRITWYLSVYEEGKLKSRTQDEGIDILRKNAAGEWKIIQYLAYER